MMAGWGFAPLWICCFFSLLSVTCAFINDDRGMNVKFNLIDFGLTVLY